MTRYEIARSISGASSAITKLKSASSNFEKGKNETKAASIKNENNYKGASSIIINGELSKNIKTTQVNSSISEQKKIAIQTRISQLQYLDRQLAAEEERERQRQAAAERERQRQAAAPKK